MRATTYVAGGLTAVALTAASLATVHALGAGTPGSGPGVAAATCQVPTLPGRSVDVMVADMGGGPMMGGGSMMAGRMMLRAAPQTVPAGPVSFVVANRGTRTHEMVVLPLPVGASLGARAVGADDRIAETGSLGEASRQCGAGEGEGIRPGGAGWVTLDLKPGRYELVCNLPGHYAAGMYAELDVN